MAEITAKPFGEMTLPELRAEYMRFSAATRPGGFACNHPSWHDIRDILATWIERREREAWQQTMSVPTLAPRKGVAA